MVGSDASSATAGSSMVRVVGNTRLPATPWANAPVESSRLAQANVPTAWDAERFIEGFLVIGLPSSAEREQVPVGAARRRKLGQPIARRGGGPQAAEAGQPEASSRDGGNTRAARSARPRPGPSQS